LLKRPDEVAVLVGGGKEKMNFVDLLLDGESRIVRGRSGRRNRSRGNCTGKRWRRQGVLTPLAKATLAPTRL